MTMTDKNYRMADVFELPVTSKDVGVFVPPCCAEDEAEYDKAVAQAVNQHDSLVEQVQQQQARIRELEKQLYDLTCTHVAVLEDATFGRMTKPYLDSSLIISIINEAQAEYYKDIYDDEANTAPAADGVILDRVTKAGQIQEGDNLVLWTKKGIIAAPARVVINPGNPDPSNGEEVVYNRSKNHYFITDMVINGKSWVKEAYVVRKPAQGAAQ